VADEVVLEDALEGHDWSRYAGPGADVRRRGEVGRRRRRVTVLGVAALVAAGAALPALWPSSERRGDPVTHTPDHIPGVPVLPKGAPYKALAGGVIAEGSVKGVFWQEAWATIPSQSAANSEPVVTCEFVTFGTVTQIRGCGEGTAKPGPNAAPDTQDYSAQAYGTLDGFTAPFVLVDGGVPVGTTSMTLRWEKGRTQDVPIPDNRETAFVFTPDDPPSTVVEQGPYGTKTLAVTKATNGMWHSNTADEVEVAPASPPSVTPLDGTPRVMDTPLGKTTSSGILGQGTVGGHRWQLAYRVIPSGSAANSSPYVTCMYLTLDGVTSPGSCDGSAYPPQPQGTPTFWFAKDHEDTSPLLTQTQSVDEQTTAVGLEWSDGTQHVTAVARLNGIKVATVAFDPYNPPAYVLFLGAYGERKVPVEFQGVTVWAIH
jgi:hypothetical protein